jgi:hypothetical protein
MGFAEYMRLTEPLTGSSPENIEDIEDIIEGIKASVEKKVKSKHAQKKTAQHAPTMAVREKRGTELVAADVSRLSPGFPLSV